MAANVPNNFDEALQRYAERQKPVYTHYIISLCYILELKL